MTTVLIAIALYLIATGMLVRSVSRDNARPGRAWAWPATAAIALHAGYHINAALHSPGGPDLHFFAALSLVSLGMAALTTLVGLRGRMATLGVVAYPMAAILLYARHRYGASQGNTLSWQLALHAWLALLAYATLGIGALLAVMLWLQERALRLRTFHGWLRVLPPLGDLESLLFRTIIVGFSLLTVTLLTGVLFVDDLLAQKLVHKTVLSVLSWIVFGVLLIGRFRWGWRGRKAVHWTLAAMVLLLLAFFGSRFVIELVLGRG